MQISVDIEQSQDRHTGGGSMKPGGRLKGNRMTTCNVSFSRVIAKDSSTAHSNAYA